MKCWVYIEEDKEVDLDCLSSLYNEQQAEI